MNKRRVKELAAVVSGIVRSQVIKHLRIAECHVNKEFGWPNVLIAFDDKPFYLGRGDSLVWIGDRRCSERDTVRVVVSHNWLRDIGPWYASGRWLDGHSFPFQTTLFTHSFSVPCKPKIRRCNGVIAAQWPGGIRMCNSGDVFVAIEDDGCPIAFARYQDEADAISVEREVDKISGLVGLQKEV